MASVPDIAEPPTGVAETYMLVSDPSDAIHPFEAGQHTLFSVAGGIALSGGSYPIVFVLGFLLILLWEVALAAFTGSASGTNGADLALAAVTGLIGMTFATFIGIMWAGFVAILVVPLLMLFVWTLGVRVSIIRFGAVSGGLVGLICVLPPILFGGSGIDWPDLFFWGVMGPALTTPLGQLGGAWGGSKANVEFWPDRGVRNVDAARHWYQFDLKQLLWFSTWLGLLLAAIHLLGLPLELLFFVLLVWLVYQAVLLWLGWLVFSRWGPKCRACLLRRFT